MGRPAAFFDVDGTLASSNVISTYLDFRLSNAGILRRWAIIGAFLPRAAFYAYLDTRSRRRFLQSFMANYAGVRPDDLRTWAEQAVHGYWARKVFTGALASIQHHRQQGHYVVILSGGLWDTLAPLAGHLGVDTLLASRMETIAGCYSGKLAGEPVSDEAKTQTSRDLAAEMGLGPQPKLCLRRQLQRPRSLGKRGVPRGSEPGPAAQNPGPTTAMAHRSLDTQRPGSSVMTDYQVVIIGGGIVGLATALALLERHPQTRLAVIEKEPALATHQTGHNSGVIHSGIYYRPGSLKARLCLEGGRRLIDFCRDHGIPFNVCGKVIVATNEGEVERLPGLLNRGAGKRIGGS